MQFPESARTLLTPGRRGAKIRTSFVRKGERPHEALCDDGHDGDVHAHVHGRPLRAALRQWLRRRKARKIVGLTGRHFGAFRLYF